MKHDDFEEVRFRRQRSTRAASRPISWGWILIAVAGLFVTLMLIRSLLHRTAGSAGSSEDALVSTQEHAAEPVVEEHVRYPSVAVAPASPIDRYRKLSRCRSSNGVVTVRSEGCDAGEQMVSEIPITLNEPDSLPITEMPSTAFSNGGHVSGQSAVIHAPRQEYSACEVAKQQRQSARNQMGLSATYEAISHLDDMVRNACR